MAVERRGRRPAGNTERTRNVAIALANALERGVHTVFVPYTTTLKKLRPPAFAYVDDIVCSAATADDIPTATAQIVALMRERHRILPGMDDDFNIRHPEEIVKAQLEASDTFARLLTAVACVALLVGGIGIMNVMLASVTERTAIGGAAGVALSALGASGIGHVVGWSLSIPVEAVLAAVVVSTAVGIIFGFLPARRAARLDPIHALRFE